MSEEPLTMSEAYEMLRRLYPDEYLQISAFYSGYPNSEVTLKFTCNIACYGNYYPSIDSMMAAVRDSALSIGERARAIK